ncbi:MAG: glycosyl hydrolase family 2 [Bacteroidales bacterium]|nr:glycosyl hydrolase family 2 [Bacteroidales bacterium]
MINFKKILLINLMITLLISTLEAQISSSFELRYYSKDKESSGITDFKGENEFFNTDQRIEFLDVYAAVAGNWFSDTALNRLVSTPAEIDRFLQGLKEQPRPDKRRRVELDKWKKTGYSHLGHEKSVAAINEWNMNEGVSVEQGSLNFNRPNVTIEKTLDSLQWRFFLGWKAKSIKGRVPMAFALKENNRIIAEAGFHANGDIFFTANGTDRMGDKYIPDQWYDFKIEVDLVNDRYNLLINGKKTGDWIAMRKSSLINRLQISGGESIQIDDITGLKFDTTGCSVRSPYTIEPFLHENFNVQPPVEQWAKPHYDDSAWELTDLPAVMGGSLEAGKDLYLRKEFNPDAFEKAWLNIETLDPGGEIWINGRVVHVTHNRHPVRVDISPFLVPHAVNTIGIRVFSFYNDGHLYHSPQDRNVGWFCGRAWIDLTEQVHMSSVKVHTRSINTEEATQLHTIALQNHADTTFSGMVTIDYYPWHPNEGSSKSASFEVPIQIFAKDSIHIHYEGTIEKPFLWTHDNPNLYRVHLKIMHDNQVIDDEMITTGIRTVSQKGGIFRINGEPELLGGAQTMGFRMPIENIVKWNRCPPASILADELLACSKLGNTLRVHVHSGGTYAYSVNDPRIAEMADQLGVMLIWPTSSWIRQGEWGGIDFEGYPKYINQVFNHPSIVLWEGSNHPNEFSGKPLSYSNRFITKMYRTISTSDSSRLISPSSFNKHFIYKNDEGTIDEDGKTIVPCEEWTAPLIVRGNQDALTGYGSEWHNIRGWPDPYRRSLLESRERAYFNFEHEESIGMQNFELVRGKPWYQMPSYENYYDIGSIGREFEYSEWKESQAWQAFSAWESMKWQRMHDVDGFSWCTLHGGANSGTYRKPLIDAMGHAKLAFYINQMALQDIIAGSNNTDVAYHRRDKITPVIMNVGDQRTVKLKIVIKTPGGEIIDTHEFNDVLLEKGRTVKELPSFRPKFTEEGYYVIEYYVMRP